MQAQSRPEPPPSEQAKSTDFIDPAACDNPGFPIMGLAPLMKEYTYGGRSQRSNPTGSPELSSTSPTSHPTVLTALPSKTPEEITSGALKCSYSRSQSSYRVPFPRSMRYTPFSGVPSHSGRGRKGRPTKHKNSTNIAGGSGPVQNRAAPRALRRFHEIRRPYVGPEQRRRDELRASYHRLKNAVPTHGLGLVSHPRPTKTALLDRAATRINSLEMSRQQLLAKIREVEEEAVRLRQANEALALSAVGQRPAAASTPP